MRGLLPRLEIPQGWQSEAFEARLALRLAELAADLRLPETPPVAFVAEESLRLGDLALRIPLSLARQGGATRTSTTPDPLDLAERVSSAACSARWRWLAPCLRRPTEALRAASGIGLDLDDLRSLDAFATDPVGCGWEASERAPASIQVLLPPEDVDEVNSALVAQAAADSLGLPVPDPLLSAEPGLEPLEIRLRIRRLRLPLRLRLAEERGARLAQAIVRAIQQDAAMLVDAQGLAPLVLDPDGASPATLQRLLQSPGADLPLLARGLAQCYDDGLVLMHPAWLRQVLLAEAWVVDDPSPGRHSVSLPGVTAVPRPSLRLDEWSARLRAALIGPVIAVAGLDTPRAVWTLSQRAADAARHGRPADLDRLARLSLPCARANGVLLAPIGQARAVRNALAQDLPTLLVCDENEWPRELKPALRGSIDLP